MKALVKSVVMRMLPSALLTMAVFVGEQGEQFQRAAGLRKRFASNPKQLSSIYRDVCFSVGPGIHVVGLASEQLSFGLLVESAQKRISFIQIPENVKNQQFLGAQVFVINDGVGVVQLFNEFVKVDPINIVPKPQLRPKG